MTRVARVTTAPRPCAFNVGNRGNYSAPAEFDRTEEQRIYFYRMQRVRRQREFKAYLACIPAEEGLRQAVAKILTADLAGMVGE